MGRERECGLGRPSIGLAARRDVRHEGVELPAREALRALALGEQSNDRLGMLARAKECGEPEHCQTMVFLCGRIPLATIAQEERVSSGLAETTARPGIAIAAEDVDLETLTLAGLKHYRHRAQLHRKHGDHTPATKPQPFREQLLKPMPEAIT